MTTNNEPTSSCLRWGLISEHHPNIWLKKGLHLCPDCAALLNNLKKDSSSYRARLSLGYSPIRMVGVFQYACFTGAESKMTAII